MKKKLQATCANCHKSFEIKVKTYNQRKKTGQERFFCSVACVSKSNVTSIKTACARCGKEILARPSRIKKSKTGNVFCSRSCAISEHNKDGRARKNGSQTYRKDAINHYGARCEICHYSVLKVLEVHHIDGNRTNNELNNLIVVCPTHHKEIALGIIKVPR